MPKLPLPSKGDKAAKEQKPRRKKSSEYHTGRLNISCPPSKKDAIAADATKHGLSISQYMMALFEKSHEAGSSEHLARMGLELVGMKKRLTDMDTRLMRSLQRAGGVPDETVVEEIKKIRALNLEIDGAVKEILVSVKELRQAGK